MVKYVMVADTNRNICKMLSELISLNKSVDMVFCCLSFKDVIRFLRLNSFDMIIIRLDESELNGLEIIRTIHENHPQCKVVIAADASYFEATNFAEKADGFLRLPKSVNNVNPIKKQLEAIFMD